MAFYGYQGNPYESNWTPYNPNPYDSYADFPLQPSSEYSAYESYDPNSCDLYPQSSSEYSAYESYDPSLSEYSNPSYSYSYSYSYYACTPPEHKLIQFPPQTTYSISYSNSEPIEPEIEVWEEYDPTPYDGGYDLVQTYGKPLPESDETCYPRSSALGAGLLDGFSYNSPPESNAGKIQKPGSTEEKNVEESGNGKRSGSPEKGLIAEDISESGDSAELSSSENDQEWISQVPDVIPFPSENDQELNRQVPDMIPYPSENDQDWNRQVPNIVPYGSGLESLDICESLFGHWPCLAKMEREKKACRACEERESRRSYDPWEVTAEYLFGSPFPYDDRLQNGGNGSPFQHQNLYTESQL